MAAGNVEALKTELKGRGGTDADWDFLVSEGLRFEDHQTFDAECPDCGDPMVLARRVMGAGRILEYTCFDGSWRGQGVALMEISDYEDERKRLVLGRHVAASDEYYEWYAGERLGSDRCVYHLCDCPGRRCRVKLTSRDRRELVHIPRWRIVNAGMMLNEGYSHEAGMARLREGVRRFVPHPVLPPAPPLREERGTGLDGVVEALRVEEKEEKPRRSRSTQGKRPKEREPTPKGSVGKMLREKAGKYEEAHPERKKRKRRRRRGGDGDRVEKKKVSRGDVNVSTDSSDENSDESSGSPFHLPPSRGGAELWRLAQKYPGRLLKSGMTEMSRYLADRAGDDMEGSWHNRKVMAYVSQVMLNQGAGGQGVGVRNQREAITLATCLDLLTGGNLAGLGDVLIQRLKALEAAMADQNWQSARRLELIPPQSAALATTGEKDQASKVELRMLKLRSAITKTKTK